MVSCQLKYVETSNAASMCNMHAYTLSHVIAPSLNQEMFSRAMELVGGEFVDRVTSTRDIWLPARELVEAAMDKRYSVMRGRLSTACREGWTSLY